MRPISAVAASSRPSANRDFNPRQERGSWRSWRPSRSRAAEAQASPETAAPTPTRLCALVETGEVYLRSPRLGEAAVQSEFRSRPMAALSGKQFGADAADGEGALANASLVHCSWD